MLRPNHKTFPSGLKVAPLLCYLLVSLHLLATDAVLCVDRDGGLACEKLAGDKTLDSFRSCGIEEASNGFRIPEGSVPAKKTCASCFDIPLKVCNLLHGIPTPQPAAPRIQRVQAFVPSAPPIVMKSPAKRFPAVPAEHPTELAAIRTVVLLI